jgi:dUTP pyrophosphatase
MTTTQALYANIKNQTPDARLANFAILKIAVLDNSLLNEYVTRVSQHNYNLFTNAFYDSGFDLLVPNQVIFDRQFDTKFIDMQIKSEMVYCDVNVDKITNCAFTIYPRSSISKTPLMLANHTGIIDSGYRGSLIGAFRSLSHQNYVVDRGTRLLQVCHPTLCPVYVVIVQEEELTTTERGSGGFGSTG